jgi:chitosanase
LRVARLLLRLTPLLAAVVLVAACAGDDGPAAPSGTEADATTATTPTTATVGSVRGGLTEDQRRRADQLVSVFENSTTEIQYAYAEDLGDGRGITSGRAGFTTATCDAEVVVERYAAAVPEAPLAGFLPELDRLCAEGSDDTSGLPADAYIEAWVDAAGDPAFRAVQDEVVDETYFLPAMALADDLGLATALARAQLYDAGIQHGIGDDPGGLPAIIERTTAAVGDPAAAGEPEWLDEFLRQRIATLEDPADEATAEAWGASVSRVECFQAIATTGDLDLDGPVECTVFGDEFTID